MLAYRLEDEIADRRGKNIVGSNLKNAGATSVGQSENPRKVEIMGKDHMLMLASPGENLAIRRFGVAYLRPVNGVVASILQPVDPCGGEVDIKEQPHSVATYRDVSFLHSPRRVG